MSGNATDVGAIRASIEVDVAGFKSDMTKVKQELTTIAEQTKKTSRGFTDLNEALAAAGASTKSIDGINAALRKANPEILERQLKEVGDELRKLGIASAEIDKITKELQEASTEGDKAAKSFGGIETALTALGAGAAAAGLARTVTTLVTEANALGNALTGVKQVAAALGHDVGNVSAATEELAKRGVLSLAESATAIKTALATGYELDESITLINTLTDAAAYNREAHLGWGEAVVTAVQGIKAGNSTLTDAAGITTNLSVMQDRYAKSIGTTAAKLTESQKAQAAYNGMIAEASLFAGNADAALEGYTGTNNSFKKSIEAARVELGEAYLPVIQNIIETITPMIQQFTSWVTANKEVVVGITAAGFAITGLIAIITTAITVVGVLKIALDALKISLGPAGWLLIGVSLLATGFTAYQLAADAASESTWKFAESQAELNAKLNESPLTRTVDDLRTMQSDIDKINELMARRIELEAEANAVLGGSVAAANARIAVVREDSRELTELNKTLADLGIVTENDSTRAIERLTAQMGDATVAQRELRMETLREIVAMEDAAAESDTLATRYRELREAQKLTKDESAELTSVVTQLTQKYPNLHTEIDEQGRLLIVNEGLLGDLVTAEQDAAIAALQAEADITASRKRTAEATVASIRTQIKAMQTLANAEWSERGNTLGFSGTFADNVVKGAANSVISDKEAELAVELSRINELQLELDAIASGTHRSLFETGRPDYGTPDDKKKAKSTKAKTAEQLAQEAYQSELKKLEIRRLLGKLTEKEELSELARLAKYYKKYDDIWIDAESRRQRLESQMAADKEKAAKEREKATEIEQRKAFDTSSEWIEKETRKMTEAGASEAEITKMQLEAWTRVRNRYGKDSDYYKRADKSMFDARMSLRKQDEALAKEIATKQKDAVKETLKAIDTQKKAELDALDKRKKAVQDYYDTLLNGIDDNERGRERALLEAEADKYRAATSDKGKAHYADVMEQLRKMDVEDQKTALEDERDTKLDALEQQKDDVESWYDDMKDALDTFNGDMIALYELLDDARLKSFVDTNATIKAEMKRFQAEMAALSASAPTSDSGTISQMSANAKAWKTADASGKAALSAENQTLGKSIGATYTSGSGKWTDSNGIPLFHRGGIVGQGNFSMGDRLMPDELTAILRQGEVVLTPAQIEGLVGGRSGGGTTVNIEKVVGLEMNDTVMEDEIDLRAVGRTADDMVTQLSRNNFTGRR